MISLTFLVVCGDDDDDNDDNDEAPSYDFGVPGNDDDDTGILSVNVKDRRIVDSYGGTVILRDVATNQLEDYFQGNPDILPMKYAFRFGRPSQDWLGDRVNLESTRVF